MSEEFKALRSYRDSLLQQSDWTQSVDSPLSESKKSEWASYRQALRDISKTATPKISSPPLGLDLSSVTFPEKPSKNDQSRYKCDPNGTKRLKKRYVPF